MSFTQIVRLRGLTGILCAVLFVHPIEIVDADSPITNELDRVRTANQTMERVAITRLELEQYCLSRIGDLKNNGHASWLEWSRQQVVVESLNRQLESLRNFNRFVKQLEEQIVELGERPGERSTIDYCEPTSIIEIDDSVISSAKQRLEQAKRRCQDFAKLGSAPAQWCRQAELQKNIAQAELKLYQLQTEFKPARYTAPEEPLAVAETASFNSVAETASLSFDAEVELQLAAYRIAWAEANSTGRLNSAKIELNQQRRRSEAVEQLYSNGIVSKLDLKKIRQSFADAVSRLEQERSRIAMLKRNLDSLKAPEQFQCSLGHDFERPRLDTHCLWPAPILCDVDRVRYLVNLRRRYFDLQGQRNANVGKLELRQSCLKKLKEASLGSTKIRSTESFDTTELRALMDVGEERQRVSLQMSIGSFEARIEDCDETLVILALKETRFLAQCAHQDRAADLSYVGTTTENQPDIDVSIRREYFRFSFDRREKSPLIHANRYSVSPIRSQQLFDFTKLKGQGGDSISRQSKQRELTTSAMSSHRNSTYSSQAVYPFGILRSDLRNQAPAGQIPWYLPGSPTNLR